MNKKVVNEGFFDNLTPESAYVLGFIYGDASVKNKRVSITNKDEGTIQQIKEAAGSSHNILFTAGVYRLVWTNQIIYDKLVEYGVTENRFPENLPSCLLPHFIRGFFDSAGHFTYETYKEGRRRLISRFLFGEKHFLEVLRGRLYELGMKSLPNVHLYNGVYSLTYYVKDTRLLYDIIYRDATIYTRWRRENATGYLSNREPNEGEEE